MNNTASRWLLLSVLLMESASCFAASEDECAIWLCMPAAFAVDGCSGAFDAMIARVTHIPPKSPLPAWSSCEYKGDLPVDDAEMSSRDGKAAYLPEHTDADEERQPSTIIKDTSCNTYWDAPNERWVTLPEYCTDTLIYAETYVDGVQMGETYFFDTKGNSYTAEVIR
jgi:hypothetical protein